jgi:hypothetical protein
MKIESRYSSLLLSHHQFQGKYNDCGPYNAAIILNSLKDKKIDARELSIQLNHIEMKGILPVIYRIPNWATFPWGITRLLREAGITAKWKVWVKPQYLISHLVDQIFIVIIGSIIPLWTHYKILTVFDPDLGWGFVDPALKEPSISWQSKNSFLSQWNKIGRMVIEITPAPTG